MDTGLKQRLIGAAVLVAMPFNFVLPLLAGYLHDVTGTYRATFAYQIAMFGFAFVMLWAAARRTGTQR